MYLFRNKNLDNKFIIFNLLLLLFFIKEMDKTRIYNISKITNKRSRLKIHNDRIIISIKLISHHESIIYSSLPTKYNIMSSSSLNKP